MCTEEVQKSCLHQTQKLLNRRLAQNAVFSLALLTFCSSPPGIEPVLNSQTVTILSGGNLLDGTGAPIRENVDIFLVEGRIEAIVDSGERPIPPNASVTDGRGKWILPGLIDSHVHYRAWMPELFLYHGVTSVFDLGNETEWVLGQRDAIREKKVQGPRLFVTGRALRGPSPAASTGPAGSQRTILHSAQEVHTYTTELLDRGVDAIKVNVWMPAEWIGIVTNLAHARNKSVVGHLSTPVHEAMEAGLDGLIHPYMIDLSTLADPAKLEFIEDLLPILVDQRKEYYPYYLLEVDRYPSLIEQMIQGGTFFNPTFGAQFRGIYPEREEFDQYDFNFFDRLSETLGYLTFSIKSQLLPFFSRLRFYEIDSVMRKKLELGMENVADFMRQFKGAGGKMVAGTDTSRIGIPGVRLHRELQLWVAQGISPMEAIRGATQYPAELFRLPDLGTVEVGKKADLLVLKGNPLEDIRLIGAVDRVFVDGIPVERELNLNPSLFTP